MVWSSGRREASSTAPTPAAGYPAPRRCLASTPFGDGSPVAARKRRRKRRLRPAGGGAITLPGGICEVAGNVRLGQPFTASRDGELGRIAVAIRQELGSTGDSVLQLVRSSGGVPSADPFRRAGGGHDPRRPPAGRRRGSARRHVPSGRWWVCRGGEPAGNEPTGGADRGVDWRKGDRRERGARRWADGGKRGRRRGSTSI